MPAFYISSTLACYQHQPGEMALGGIASTASASSVQFKHASPELYWRETPYAAGDLFQLGKKWPIAPFSNDRNLGSAAPFTYMSPEEWRIVQFTVLSLANVAAPGGARVFAFISG